MTNQSRSRPGLDDRLRRARELIAGTGGAVVAVSGGVDSAVLLALAVEELGPARVAAAAGVSGSLPDADLADARVVAASLGVDLVEVETRELDRPGYRANAGDRCFHCRVELFEHLEVLRVRRGLGRVLYGAIVDDLGDHRPGMSAATRLGVAAPLLDAGLDKVDVRAIAGRLGLAVADKPAAACLASRIPVGTVVTAERLGRVARAEDGLRALGLAGFRVRDHGDVARIELLPADLDRIGDPGLRERVLGAVAAAGFAHVTVDLAGYRRGSVAGSGAPMREGGQ